MAEMLRDGKALVRVRSHRARDKLTRAIGRKSQSYFSFYREGEWHEVSLDELVKIQAAKIKGVTRSAWAADLLRTWSWT